MTTVNDLQTFFQGLDYKVIIAADGETRSHKREGDRIVEQTPAGGVSVAFDVLCQASGGTYIARGKTAEDMEVAGPDGKVQIDGTDGHYTLKRLSLSPEEEEFYYAGFSNQTLWPLSHITFQRPTFRNDWFESYAEINKRFARSIEEELEGKSFVWVNDYQLALVPGALHRGPDTVVGLFWHIPWPTWEVFRILPQKREILNSMLSCDYIAFHRRYQARNFLNAVDRELGARIDFETSTVFVGDKVVRVGALPMGIDVDVVRKAVRPDDGKPSLLDTIRTTFGFGTPVESSESTEDDTLTRLAQRYSILLGVDRLDYTKGIKERLMALDRFFELFPERRGEVVYVGIMSPTREAVPAYQGLRDEIQALADDINARYSIGDWSPLHMVYGGFTREDVMGLYQRARICLVTPLDDGMNLVSKEFVVAASCVDDPGMLVLSQFAGSAIDLAAALIVNPYDADEVAAAINEGLDMDVDARRERIAHMADLLEERNVYEWAMSFVRNSLTAAREQQLNIVPIA